MTEKSCTVYLIEGKLAVNPKCPEWGWIAYSAINGYKDYIHDAARVVDGCKPFTFSNILAFDDLIAAITAFHHLTNFYTQIYELRLVRYSETRETVVIEYNEEIIRGIIK